MFIETALPKLGMRSLLVCCLVFVGALSDNIESSHLFLMELLGVGGQDGVVLMAVLSSVEQRVVVLDLE